MDSQKLKAKTPSIEALRINELIGEKKNFLLSGGAGSGKTYTLVETIRAVLSEYPLANIACITYTNSAVNEIADRVIHPNLSVSTIHDFLWDNIKHFQEELNATIIELINDDEQPIFKKPDDENITESYFDELPDGIQYKEFVRIKDGIISHDELLILAHRMYEKHTRLSTITKDTYPFIFVDEYQDTDPNVIRILLQQFEKSDKECVVGFFGDAMQSIYDGSIGDLEAYTKGEAPKVIEVKKEQNRRNPILVIDLANKLRSDGLIQYPSDDTSAPNMNSEGAPKNGSILFLHSADESLERVREYLRWNFTDAKQTKELNLTQNLIAGKAGFGDLLRIYNNDKILAFVRRIKKYIKKDPTVIDAEGKTFGEVVEELQRGKSGKALTAVSPTNGMTKYIADYPAIFQMVLQYPYVEIASIFIDKDQLIDGKKNDTQDEEKVRSQRDDLIKHLFKIQHNIQLYNENRINEFVRHTDFNLSSINARRQLKEHIEDLINVRNKTIGQVIEEAHNNGIALIDDRLTRFEERKAYIYNQVIELPYSQLQNLYWYIEGYTPFSTQHKTKGAQFPKVLIILDNGNWNDYNFEVLFTEQGKDRVLKRPQKIFYVCCTRAMENVAVFYHSPSPAVVAKAQEWFGIENVVNLDDR